MNPKLSLFLPVYNEEENLSRLNEKIFQAMEGLGHSFEVIYVDDGSADRSLELLKGFAAIDRRVRVIAFRRNYGQTAAMAAGIARMVDVVGIDHVGLGSDMLGLTSPSVFSSYRELPELADALLAVGFRLDDAAKILGGNYARVFAASVG